MAEDIVPQSPKELPGVQPTLPIGTGGKTPTPGAFQSYMESAQGSTLGKTTGGQTPFEVMQGQTVAASGANMGSVLSQINASSNTLGDLASDLNTPNLKLKRSQRWLMKNKLENATGQMRAANKKMGVEAGPEPEAPSEGGPITKFLSYVTDGQYQLEQAKDHINQLNASGESLNPTDLLLIQIKLAKAQQELNYTSVILGKAVDDMRTLMNVQL